MAKDGDIVFMIGADTTGLNRAGQSGEKSLAQMERAAKTLERQIDKIGAAGVEFQREMNKLSGVTREVAKSAKDSAAAFEAFDRSRAQVDALRASIDPLFAASKRYEAALQQLDGALEQGAISAREHARMTEMVTTAMFRADPAMQGMGGSLGFLGNMSQQARGKIQQVGFQVQDFAVQVGAGTSATQAFAQQFPQMAGAFGPWGIAIGTAAAILVPLGVALLSTTGEADALTEALERQQEVLDRLSEAAASLQLERQMLFSGAEIIEEQKALNEINRLIERRVKIEALLAGQFAVITQRGQEAQKQNLQAERESLEAERQSLTAKIETLKKERELKSAAEEAKKAAELMRTVMGQIASADISGPWTRVLGDIQAAINKAREYVATHASMGKVYGVVGAQGNPLDYGANPGTSNTFDTENFPTPDSEGGGGGGGGDNPFLAEIDALREKLMTEEELELESFAKRQAALQKALDQRLITEKEYAALMEREHADHAQRMKEIDVWRYGSTLDKAEAFMGGMATILQAGGKKQQKIASIFAAAQALISTYQGAAKELEKGTFGFASAAAVIAKGMGFVAAIRNAGKGSGGGGGGGGAAVSGGGGAAAQAPATTMNFHVQNDPFGYGERFARSMAQQMNDARRSGSQIIATVASS